MTPAGYTFPSSSSTTLTPTHLTCYTGDIADHPITDQLMNVIWSFGQVFPDYYHSPGSGIEAGTAQNNRFYQPDEIKYHGGNNRGSTSLNFFGKQYIFECVVWEEGPVFFGGARRGRSLGTRLDLCRLTH